MNNNILDINKVIASQDGSCSMLSTDSPDPVYAPEMIFRPETADDIGKIIEWARADKKNLYVSSSTDPHFSGLSAPLTEGGMLVDLSGMKKIISANRQQRMAVLEAGVTYEELIPALKAQDMELSPSLKPRAGKSVLADILLQNPRINPSRQWNYVEPLRCLDVTWGDGNHMYTGSAMGNMDLAAQQAKGNWQDYGAGPMMIDYARLMTGSLGSLGISTWVSLRCDILPKVRKLFFVASDDVEKIIALMYDVLRVRLHEEIFLLNKTCAEAVFGKSCNNAPEWLLVLGAAGRDILPQMRFDGMVSDIKQYASAYGLALGDSYGDIDYKYAEEVLFERKNAEYFWKHAGKAHASDIYFTSTPDRLQDFNNAVFDAAERSGLGSVAVYVQPQHQGVCCQIEYVAAYDESERAAADGFFKDASFAVKKQNGYFSRPFNRLWMQLAYDSNSRELAAGQSVKKIFDPDGIMSPGRVFGLEV